MNAVGLIAQESADLPDALQAKALEPGKPLSFLDHHIRVGQPDRRDAGADRRRDSGRRLQAHRGR